MNKIPSIGAATLSKAQCGIRRAQVRMLLLVALLVALPGSYGSTSQDELQSTLVLNQKVLENLLVEKLKCDDNEIREVTDDVISQLRSLHEELKTEVVSQILNAIAIQETELKGDLYDSLREIMGEQINNTLRTQTTKMQQLEAQLRQQEEKIQRQEEKIQAQEERIHAQEEKIQTQEEKFQAQEEKFQTQEDKIQTQEEKIQTQEEKFQGLEERIQGQEEKIQAQEDKIQTQEDKIQTQEEKMQAQVEKIQGQEEKIQAQEEKIQTQEEKIQAQEEKIHAQEEKIQTQEQEVQQLSGEVRGLKRQQETENIPSTTVERNETDNLPQDCSHHWRQHMRESGRYTIFPVIGGPGVDVWCDMAADGPWTVILSRSPQPHRENFSRSWEEYKAGFGNASAEYWLGLDALHALTSRTPHLLKVQIQFFDGQDYDGGLRKFVVSDEDLQYEVRMEGGYGIGKYLLVNNGMKFTTTDRDNDQSSFDCAKIESGGGWWYGSVDMHAGGTAWSSVCTLASPTGKVATSEYRHGGVMSWPFEEKKRYISLKKVVMKIQPNYK